MTNFSTPLPLYAPVNILDDPSPFPQLRTYLIDGLFFNQKTNNNIRMSYSLIHKHSKKNKFLKSHTRPKILHLISVTISHINFITIVHFQSYLNQFF